MQVNDLPVVSHSVQHDSAPVQHPRTIIQMECSDGYVSEPLDVQIVRLQVHEWGLFSIATNLRENLLKISLEFGAPMRTTGSPARVEHRSIVRKETAESLPIEVV